MERSATRPLEVRNFYDVTIQPIRRSGRGEKPSFGAHDANGTFLAAFARPLADRWCVPATPKAASRTVTSQCVYGGVIVGHYGLFILETLARYWAIRKYSDIPICWTRLRIGNTHEKWSSWLDKIFILLGFDTSRLLFVEEPTCFKSIIVPDPGFQHLRWLHPSHAEALGVIGIVPSAPTGFVWLSRRGLPDGFSRIDGELALEDLLRREGWTIVQPERLPLDEQIGMFASASVIAGFSSSAFHNVLLQRAPSARLRILLREKVPMTNYETIASVRAIDQRIIDVGVRAIDEKSARTSYVLDEPDVVFRTLLASI